MNLRSFLVVLATIVVLATGANAQERLGDLVTDYGYGWLIGKWQATTDEGDTISFEYKWQLDKHAILVHVKMPEFEYAGMIFFRPMQEDVVQIGVDNRGGNGKGTWDAMDGKALLKYEHTSADWETHRMAIAHGKVDNNTMKTEIYEMDSTGWVSPQPSHTLQYKPQKTK
jgi:hypothetical protein